LPNNPGRVEFRSPSGVEVRYPTRHFPPQMRLMLGRELNTAAAASFPIVLIMVFRQ